MAETNTGLTDLIITRHERALFEDQNSDSWKNIFFEMNPLQLGAYADLAQEKIAPAAVSPHFWINLGSAFLEVGFWAIAITSDRREMSKRMAAKCFDVARGLLRNNENALVAINDLWDRSLISKAEFDSDDIRRIMFLDEVVNQWGLSRADPE